MTDWTYAMARAFSLGWKDGEANAGHFQSPVTMPGDVPPFDALKDQSDAYRFGMWAATVEATNGGLSTLGVPQAPQPS